MERSSGYYIDLAKKSLGFSSDSALADYLEIRPQALNQMRRRGLSKPMAKKIAQVANVDLGEVILISWCEKERDTRVKSALVAYSKKVLAPLYGFVAAVALSVGLSSPSQVNAQPAIGGEGRFRAGSKRSRKLALFGVQRRVRNAFPRKALSNPLPSWQFSRLTRSGEPDSHRVA